MTDFDIFDTFPGRETEEAVIAAFFSDAFPERLPECAGAGLDAGWCLWPENAQLVETALGLFREGRYSLNALSEVMRERGADVLHLSTLASRAVDPMAFSDALSRMAEGARLRRFHASVWRLHDSVFDYKALTLSDRLQRMESGLGEIVAESAGSETNTYAGEALARLAGGGDFFTPTGIYALDSVTGGYPKGRITLLAGRPSNGKTALGLELSLRMARRGGRALYFSAEMSARAVADRLIAHMAGYNSRKVAGGHYGANQLSDARTRLAALDLTVDEAPSPTTSYMMGRALALHHAKPVDLVVMDYLQYTGERAESTRLSYDAALLGMHEIAKRLECPFVCLAQLNREIERRGELAEPQLADIKETGGAEEKPALVLMVQHPWTVWYQQGRKAGTEPPRRDFRLFVRKNTHGPLGSVTLDFDRETGRFVDTHEPTP